MPPGEGKRRAPPAAGGDGIDVLPDEVLWHILGFLEAQESVRTCVLARRWRDLWKSAMGLRILADESKFLGSMEKLCNFIDRLLQNRQDTPLHTCELRFTSFGQYMSSWYENRLRPLVNTWFWHAVRCQVRVLRLGAFNTGCLEKPSVALYDRSINSQHLMRLELDSILVNTRFLDLSNCPVLEHLEVKNCYFKSDDGSRLHICAPSLGSLVLHIHNRWCLIPMLESMPSLVKAVITTEDSGECCLNCYPDICNCDFTDCEFGDNYDSVGDDCVLLDGLSNAKDLTLISEPETFIFNRDLRWCPMFSKLKTLLLNEYWCVPDDFRALVCILEHSPVLEKLTLELFSKKHEQQRERKGSLRPMEGSAAISKHLKIIDIRCHTVDEKICKLALFLCAFPIRFELVDVQENLCR